MRSLIDTCRARVTDQRAQVPATSSFANEEVLRTEVGQSVSELGHEAVTDIPIGVAVIRFDVVLLRGGAAVIRVGREVEIVRPGVAERTTQPMELTLTQNRGERVVVGPLIFLKDADGTEELVGPLRVE